MKPPPNAAAAAAVESKGHHEEDDGEDDKEEEDEEDDYDDHLSPREDDLSEDGKNRRIYKDEVTEDLLHWDFDPDDPEDEGPVDPTLNDFTHIGGVRVRPFPERKKGERVRPWLAWKCEQFLDAHGYVSPHFFKHMDLIKSEANYIYGKLTDYGKFFVEDAWPWYEPPPPQTHQSQSHQKEDQKYKICSWAIRQIPQTSCRCSHQAQAEEKKAEIRPCCHC